ncbi:Hemolysin [Patulibacter medicamentivorans]|uniref:Hemolysin n=1 Tax=Patulibacter medicamentivorans TaxID=1097667 RepID=H0E7L4_9ACTN|nr:hemolysin family protein [Patulibacter medicamentivorans]EHN10288.1 Hemolysin [Patulibacter medicamentivorans]
MVLASGGTVAVELVVAGLLVLANGFFVASEFSLARVRDSQIEDWVTARRPGAKSVRHAVDHIDAYLAACQLGITLASLGLGAFGEPAFDELLHPILGDGAKIGSVALASVLAFSIITLLHVVAGELAPKSAAIARTGPVVLALMPLLRAFYLLTRPVVQLFNGLGNLLLKPFGIPPASEAGSSPHTQRELLQIIREANEGGEINPAERRLTENVFEYDDRRVREVMVPRRKAVLVHDDESLEEAAHLAVETGVTRMPLCPEDAGLDGAHGVVHAKDLLAALLEDRRPSLVDLARPVVRVGDAAFVGSALREMRRARQHLAIVIDEHGTAVGIVTVEDVIEELVGEIEDEFDRDAERLIRIDSDGLLVDGEAGVNELLDRLEIVIDESDIHEATVGGHLLETIGRLPSPGEELELFGRRVEVEEVAEGRIRMIRVLGPAGVEPAPDDD